jgi:hypothetical protein
MRTILIIIFIAVFTTVGYAQQIDYTIPARLEGDISKEDYKKIVDIALPVIKKQYKIESVKDGAVRLSETANMSTLYLDNLIIKCTNEQDKSRWADIVQEHLMQLFSSAKDKDKMDLYDFEKVKQYLAIRIYPKETVQLMGGKDNVICRQDLAGTYTLLMLDLPTAFSSVDRSMFAHWKQDTALVFKIAQENTNRHPVEKLTQKFAAEGGDIEISFFADDNYATSYALDLPTNAPEFIGEWGSVVAMPNKALVNICKISKERPLDFVVFIQRTKALVEKFYKQHPHPVSVDFFWYYKGVFTKIVVQETTEGQVSVVAPAGLMKFMVEKK